MGQQIAEVEHRIVEIVAEHRLAEMLEENPPDRAAGVEDAAVVAGAGPELVALLGIIDQGAEEWRLQRLGVLPQPADQVLGDEIGRFLGEEHVAVGFAQHIDGNVFQPVAADQDDDRHVEAALADQRDQPGHLALRPALAPVQQHAANRGIGLDHQFGVIDLARFHDAVAVALDLLGDRLEPLAFQVGRARRRARRSGT